MLQAALAQQVARILGKDEVGGSNPLGSFIRNEDGDLSRLIFLRGFFFILFCRDHYVMNNGAMLYWIQRKKTVLLHEIAEIGRAHV